MKKFKIRMDITVDGIDDATLELYIQKFLEAGPLAAKVVDIDAKEVDEFDG